MPASATEMLGKSVTSINMKKMKRFREIQGNLNEANEHAAAQTTDASVTQATAAQAPITANDISLKDWQKDDLLDEEAQEAFFAYGGGCRIFYSDRLSLIFYVGAYGFYTLTLPKSCWFLLDNWLCFCLSLLFTVIRISLLVCLFDVFDFVHNLNSMGC